MPKQVTREIDRFDCKGDDGKSYVVVEYQHYAVRETLSGPRKEVPTIKEFRLSGGPHITRRDDGTFQIIDAGAVIRRID